MIDDEDLEAVSRHKWHMVDTKGNNHEYARTSIKQPDGRLRKVRLHRFLMQPPSDMVIDHINGNGLDNRRSNLRICTHSQNTMNQKAQVGRSSKYRGVFRHKTPNKKWDRWRANVQTKGKRFDVGLFVEEEDAARAYDKKAREIFGEFARLNFPEAI